MLLNENQEKAVQTDSEKVLVIAGPGSGKTRVMVNRVARLIKQGCSGHNILMLTFTNKSAREMKERLSLIAPEQEVNKMWIGTFHSIALRMLKEYGELLGYKKNITIYDSMDQEDILRMLIDENSIDMSIKNVLTLLNKLYSGKYDDGYNDEFYQLLILYKNFLKKNNAVDFGMILLETSKLLEKFPHVQKHYEHKFTHCLVDEYQDTDETQFNLHSIINSENLFCVGDPDQNIYSWRGASIDIILGFEKTFKDAEVIHLSQNYRSTKKIVEASKNVISNNKDRIDIDMQTDKDGVGIRCGQDQLIPGIVSDLINTCDQSFKDIAILARNHQELNSVARQMKKLEIPYNQTGKTSTIFSTYEARQILRLLKLIHNPSDDFSCRMVANWPNLRFTEQKMAQFELDAVTKNKSLLEILCNDDNGKFFEYFSNMYFENNKVLFFIGFLKSWLTDIGHENLKFMDDIQFYINKWIEYSGESSLSKFLNHIATRSFQDDIREEENKVTLSTIHAAKGLEWPVVIIVGCEEGTLPQTRKTSNIEEERRLMYVAMTRAKDLLMITHKSEIKDQWTGETKLLNPSRFINEYKRGEN